MRENKKVLALALALGIFSSSSVYASDLKFSVDGINYTTNEYTQEEGIIYYKLDTICDILGIKFTRNKETVLVKDEIVFDYLDNQVKVNLVTNMVTKNGVEISTSYIPVEKNGEIVVPVRFFEDLFGYAVSWDGETNSVILNSKDEFDILEDVSRKGENLTLEEAVKKAINNSDSLDTIFDSIEDAEESIRLLELTGGSGRAIYELDSAQRTLEKLKFKEEITKMSIQSQVEQMFISIKNAETSLAVTKYSLELSKKNLEITKQKYALGMISLKEMEAQETSYNKSVENISTQEKSINELYKSLNEFMGEDKNKQYSLIFDVVYRPVGENFECNDYINKELSENINLKSDALSLEDNKEDLSYYWSNSNATYDGYLTKKEALENKEKDIIDSKEDLEEKIKDTYEDLLDYEKDYEDAQKDLKDAIEDYEILKLKYNLGQATKLQLESEKLNVVKAQIAIQQLVYKYDLLLYKFNNTELL